MLTQSSAADMHPALLNTAATTPPSMQSTGLTLDFEPKFSTVTKGRVPAALEWQDIKYTVGTKPILHGVSGQAFVRAPPPSGERAGNVRLTTPTGSPATWWRSWARRARASPRC